MIHARESNYGRRNSSKEGRASLADDIHSIRIALTGASATAKERTLKTLERLTARLALAESERDVALGKKLPHYKTIHSFLFQTKIVDSYIIIIFRSLIR